MAFLGELGYQPNKIIQWGRCRHSPDPVATPALKRVYIYTACTGYTVLLPIRRVYEDLYKRSTVVYRHVADRDFLP